MNYYLMGIGGTGMSALANMLKLKGHTVTGSDSGVYPPVSTMLDEWGIPYFKEYDSQNVKTVRPDLVVVGNVISRGNPEIEYVLDERLPFISMPEVVKKEFLVNKLPVVITGTHGKTTTTSLISHIFEHARLEPGFLIGGRPGNFSISGRPAEKGKYFVIEGDEYDSSLFDKRAKFFHYLPQIMLINNLEFDHGDIYRDMAHILETFRFAMRQIPSVGHLVINGDDKNIEKILEYGFGSIIRFGTGEINDYKISNIKSVNQTGMGFQLSSNGETGSWELPLPGEFNVRNATGAIIVSKIAGVSEEVIRSGLKTFINTTRRLERKNKSDDVLVFEDFAHHPTAIYENIKALKNAYPDRSLIVAYEPRSNTSVRKFHQEKMATAFALAEEVVISKLHRVDTVPIEDRLNVQDIVAELTENNIIATHSENFEELQNHLKREKLNNAVIVCMSQGFFNNLASNLGEYYDWRV